MNNPVTESTEKIKIFNQPILELAKELTVDQRAFLDGVFAHSASAGEAFPKRRLPQLIGKQRLEDVLSGIRKGLFISQNEAGAQCYTVTVAGALVSSAGPLLLSLFLRLLDLVKNLYDADNALKNIDSRLISEKLALTESESPQLATIVRLMNLYGMPFHYGGHSADRSIWYLSITDEVVELFQSSSSLDFLSEKLRLLQPQPESFDAQAALFPDQTIRLFDVADQVERSRIYSGNTNIVSQSRIEALEEIVHLEFDCARLVCLCKEINECASRRNSHAVILLTRAILDHIPPVFRYQSFREVAANYGAGGKSFKSAVERLEKQARTVADRYLHQPIRTKEIAPEMNEVDFSPELEMMLAEVCRVLKSTTKPQA